MAKTLKKPELLLSSADKLIHAKGFQATTLADIADHSGVPLGNIYYYFKTKDEIGAAVIRMRETRLQLMLDGFSDLNTPVERLMALTKTITANKKDIVKYGCPIANLSQEVGKIDSSLIEKADSILRLLVDWAIIQFKEMGHKDAKMKGIHFVSHIEGMTVVAKALRDPKVINSQVKALNVWVAEL
jgi:AcrR family transcriptional regulator